MHRRLSAAPVLLLLIGVWLGGCATLPQRPPNRPASVATPLDEATPLGRIARASTAGSASGFGLMPIAGPAYEARLALIDRATHSIDFQTFILGADRIGTPLLDRMRRAAQRGVRVRILVDDLYSDVAEGLLSDLAAFPGIEVRLVNPFAGLRSSQPAKILTSLADLGRVNHRMHNKLLVADNALAVFGGRNSADDYFMLAARGGNFVDLDVLAAGDAVQSLSRSFDDYWNSDHAWPIDAVVPPSDAAPDRRARFIARAAKVEPPPHDDGVPARFARYTEPADAIRRGDLQLLGASARVVTDPSSKLGGSHVGRLDGTVRAAVSAMLTAGRRDVFMVSPYFVPDDAAVGRMRANVERGVRVRLLTNSLAATDEPAVHASYARYRRAMLEAGVEIHELSPRLARERGRLGRFRNSNGALHAKFAVVDRARVYIGSMNLDGRSGYYNSEDGVTLESEALAEELLSLMDFESSAYRLRLAPDGELEWLESGADGSVVVHRSEPESGWWTRLKSRLTAALLPERWF